MISPFSLLSGTPIYTFIAPDGINTHIAASLLREWALRAKPEIVLTPTDRELARSFIRDNIVSKHRCLQLARRSSAGEDIFEPILYCHDGGLTQGRPDVLLVDGHHRFFLASIWGQLFIKSHILTEAQWRPFQIASSDGPFSIDTTSDDLRRKPITPRNY